MSRVVLFGTGRGADVAHRYLTHDSEHEVVGFAVDRDYLEGDTFRGLRVVPFETVEEEFPPDRNEMLVLLGYQEMNRLRARKYLEAKAKGYTLASYVSSDVFRLGELSVGENCFILDNQSINQDVRIGNNVVLWSSNHLGDLSVVEDHAWLSSHVTVAGSVRIGQASFLGIGATVSNHVTLAGDTFVGANALITSNTKTGGVYVAGESKCVSEDSRTFMKVMEAAGKV